jgi:hypothetical protein
MSFYSFFPRALFCMSASSRLFRSLGVSLRIPGIFGKDAVSLVEGAGLFPHRNVCSSQPCVSREQRRLCSGLVQGRLSFGLGLLGPAHPIHTSH